MKNVIALVAEKKVAWNYVLNKSFIHKKMNKDELNETKPMNW